MWDRLKKSGLSADECTARVSKVFGPPKKERVGTMEQERRAMTKNLRGAIGKCDDLAEKLEEIEDRINNEALTLAECRDIDVQLREAQTQMGYVKNSLKRLREDIAAVAGVNFHIPTGGGDFR